MPKRDAANIRLRCILPIAFAIAIPALIAIELALNSPRSLLIGSTLVTPVAEWDTFYANYYWIDDHRILHWRRYRLPPGTLPPHRLNPDEFDVYAFDRRTGADRPLRHLAALFRKYHAERGSDKAVSPDGEWIYSNGSPAFSAKIDGSRIVKWDWQNGTAFWFGDSDRILGAGLYGEGGVLRSFSDIYHVGDPSRENHFPDPVTSINSRRSVDLDYPHALLTPAGQFVAPARQEKPVSKTRIYQWKPGPVVPPLITRTVLAPRNHLIKDVVIHPSGKRLVLHTVYTESGGLPTLITRLLPFLKQPRKEYEHLWKCDVDAGNLADLGRVQRTGLRQDEFAITGIQFTWARNQVSYIVNDRLYIIPLD